MEALKFLCFLLYNDITDMKDVIKICIKVCNTQFIPRKIQLCRNDRTGSRQASARNTKSDVLCVDLTKSAESGDANFQIFHFSPYKI